MDKGQGPRPRCGSEAGEVLTSPQKNCPRLFLCCWGKAWGPTAWGPAWEWRDRGQREEKRALGLNPGAALSGLRRAPRSCGAEEGCSVDLILHTRTGGEDATNCWLFSTGTWAETTFHSVELSHVAIQGTSWESGHKMSVGTHVTLTFILIFRCSQEWVGCPGPKAVRHMPHTQAA